MAMFNDIVICPGGEWLYSQFSVGGGGEREWLGEKTTIGHRNSENVLSIITFFFFCGCYCSYDISIHGFLFQSPWYLQSFCMINKFDLFY